MTSIRDTEHVSLTLLYHSATTLKQLMYTKETPDEYEPPGFQKGCEEDIAWFEDEPISVKPGKISTPFHNVSVTVRAQASSENIKAGVLKRRLEEEPDDSGQPLIKNRTRRDIAETRVIQSKVVSKQTQDHTEIDVGRSDGNSVRVTKGVVARDTQDEMDTDEDPRQTRSPYIAAGTETSCTKTKDSNPLPFSNNQTQNAPSRLQRKRRKVSKVELVRK